MGPKHMRERIQSMQAKTARLYQLSQHVPIDPKGIRQIALELEDLINDCLELHPKLFTIPPPKLDR